MSSLENIIPKEFLTNTIDRWRQKRAEYVECRAELRRILRIEIRDKEIRQFNSAISSGVAVRVLLDGKIHFFSISAGEIGKAELTKEKPLSNRSWLQKAKLRERRPIQDSVIVEEKQKLANISHEEKIKFVKEMHEEAFGDKVKTVSTIYSEDIVEKLIITSEGTDVHMRIPYVILRHEITAESNGRINASRGVWGGIGGFEIMSYNDVLEMTQRTRKSACDGVVARRCPSGKFRVLLDGDLNHLLAHEALGHAAEADSLRTGSVLKGKLGKKIASSLINIVDDGRFEINGVKGFGWIPYDDEGTPTQRTLIIQEGVLKSYMSDRITAAEYNIELTGNSRAQDWTLPNIVRMRNTFIESSSPDKGYKNEELLEELRNGLLLRRGRGGQVDPTRGVFTFGVQEAYLVRNGEVVERLSSTSISGNILVVLKNIEAIGREFDPPQESAGYCGKIGLVPVGASGPWILVKNLTVGG
ncbi:MAG: TldD/PmbA family protein [Candidatus Njordarchaeales archaeon]